MAYEIGGRADKYGNRFEYNWTISKVLDVIEERISYIVVEAIGEDEAGVDLWIGKKDGSKEAQQCKGRCGSFETWTYGRLNEKGIWKNWGKHLSRDNNISVALVSPLSFTVFEDICQRARDNGDDADLFYEYQIMKSGRDTIALFRDGSGAMGIDLSSASGKMQALKFWRRMHYRQFPDSELREINIARISRLFIGCAEDIYRILLDMMLNGDIYGKELDLAYVDLMLKKSCVQYRNLACDDRILPMIERINQEYSQSFTPFSCGVIGRKQSLSCWDKIEGGKSIVIHGCAGVGKSGTTENIISKCKDNGVPYIAVKLDKHIPENNSEEWGKKLGLPASISHCIAALTNNERAVIILDQLDALRWTQSHSGSALSVCIQIINEIKEINQSRKYPISLVFVCRSYDLENDNAISALFDEKEKWDKVLIGKLERNEVRSLIGNAYDSLSKKTQELLLVASNLFIWEKLDKENSYEKLEATYQLVQEWWRQLTSKCKGNGLNSSNLQEYKDKIVSFCNSRGEIAVPEPIVGMPGDYKDYLESNGFIVITKSKVSFTHQSILDCFLVEQMIKRYYEGDSVETIIGEIEEQTPGRRYQTQIFLQQIEEISLNEFINIGKMLLYSKNIRYSFKYIFFELISQIKNPNKKIVDTVVSLLSSKEWEKPIINTVIMSSEAYALNLLERGVLTEWIDDDSKRGLAIGLLCLIKSKETETVANIIKSHCLDDETGREWQACFSRDIYQDSDELFEVRMLYYKKFPAAMDRYVDVKNLFVNCEARAIRLIALMLENKSNQKNRGGYRYAEDLISEDTDFVINEYERIIDSLLPLLPKVEEDVRYTNWASHYSSTYSLERVCVLLLKYANHKMIIADSNQFWNTYAFCLNSGNALYNELLLDAFLHMDADCSDKVVSYILENLEKNLVEDCSGLGNKLYLAKEVISKHAKNCAEDIYMELEKAIIHFSSDRAKRTLEGRIDHNRDKSNEYFCHVYWLFWGDFQYEMLPNLPKERRSTEAENLIEVLKRRVKGRNYESSFEYSSNSRCYSVISPVSGKDISLNNWFDIISNPKIGKRERTKYMREKDIAFESSIEQFSTGFRQFAEMNPKSVVEELLVRELDINVVYIDSVFAGISNVKETDVLPLDLFEQLVKKYGYDYDSYRAANICEYVEKINAMDCSDYLLQVVIDIAKNHKNPDIDKPVVTSKEDDSANSVEMLECNALNCVRGHAIRALSHLLWERKELFEDLKETIEFLIIDKNPVIRFASLDLLWPVYNIDREWARDGILSLYKGDIRMMGYRDSRRMLVYSFDLYRNEIVDMVKEAYDSSDKRLSNMASYTITELYMLKNEFQNLYDIYNDADKEKKKHILEMIIIYFNVPDYKEKSKALLEQIIMIEDDEDNEFVWGRLFRDNMLDYTNDKHLIVNILSSKIKRNILSSFAEYIAVNGELFDYADVIIEASRGILNEFDSDNYKYWGYDTELSKLIIGLYDAAISSDCSETASECLDIWDEMYQHNVGMARTLTEKMMSM